MLRSERERLATTAALDFQRADLANAEDAIVGSIAAHKEKLRNDAIAADTEEANLRAQLKAAQAEIAHVTNETLREMAALGGPSLQEVADAAKIANYNSPRARQLLSAGQTSMRRIEQIDASASDLPAALDICEVISVLHRERLISVPGMELVRTTGTTKAIKTGIDGRYKLTADLPPGPYVLCAVHESTPGRAIWCVPFEVKAAGSATLDLFNDNAIIAD